MFDRHEVILTLAIFSRVWSHYINYVWQGGRVIYTLTTFGKGFSYSSIHYIWPGGQVVQTSNFTLGRGSSLNIHYVWQGDQIV